MGKQINFLMDFKTELDFVNQVLGDGSILFEGEGKPEFISALPEPFTVRGWFQVFLYQEQFGELLVNDLPDGRKYISSTDSPVIEYKRTSVREGDKVVSRGRLYVNMKYYDVDGNEVEKSKALDDWYKKLSMWIKKHLPRTEIEINGKLYKEFMSPVMKTFLEENEYRISL